MDEDAILTLPPVHGVNLEEYKHTLIERFLQSAGPRHYPRLCAEGSDRIPRWLVPVIHQQLATGGKIRAFGRGWARNAEGVDEQGQPIEVVDRLADRLTRVTRPGTPAESCCALRSLPPSRKVIPYRTATALAPSTRGRRRDRTKSPVRDGRRCRCLTGRDCASPTPAHYHAGERPAARACAAGLALLTVRAAEGAAKVNRCRETAR